VEFLISFRKRFFLFFLFFSVESSERNN